MIYAYKCRTCGRTKISTIRADRLEDVDSAWHSTHPLTRDICSGFYTRDFSGISFGSVPQTAYNKTLNREISSGKPFDEALKRESEIASIRTGMEHRYERVDPTDKKALGVTEEGMDATRRQQHDGRVPR